jgi:SHS2 domain-containing protein
VPVGCPRTPEFENQKQMKRSFTEFDHSGDIGIEAYGKSLEDVLIHLTQGLFGLMYRGAVRTVIERRVRIQSSSSEELLVDWLSEVLSLSAVHGELYGKVTVEQMGEDIVEAIIAGERLDPARHELRFEVKAATYHGLRLDRRGNDLIARVIFDL